ncbi:DedA family protein [Bacillus sp. V5-8f]|uniref:DedA family protein n=1 Tax=Bacillus sp. V5-8f TaxID=2053044 RepID=UPI000C78C71B|nr:DedA family protein [Bacillus sp. V5-8f]PLT33716.1 DedA family protein [Bacillus sp. V5-8f]
MDYIINILELLANLGYAGIALGLMIEIIPSELVLGYGGFLISSGRIHFFGAFLAGVVGGTLAQLILYWAGYYGGRPFLIKYGKYIFITERHIDVAEQWFQKYGTGVIFTARFIPVVRHAISIPAGIAKMSVVKFTMFTIAAIVPWTIFFLVLGKMLGGNWREIKGISEPYIIPVVILAFVMAVLYYIWRRKHTPPIVTVHTKIKTK